MIAEINKNIPSELTVNMLEEALQRAKDGLIQSVVIFGTDSDGCAFNQFNVEKDFMLILAAARLAERDLIDLHADIRKNVSWNFCDV